MSNMPDDYGEFVWSAWRACIELDARAKRLAYIYPEVAWRLLVTAETAEQALLTRLAQVVTDEPWTTDEDADPDGPS